MPIEVVNPSYEEAAVSFEPARRLTRLHGVTVGIVSNGKQGTRPFFDALAIELLAAGVAEVDHVTKPNYSAPAGSEILDRAKRWQALVAGVGD